MRSVVTPTYYWELEPAADVVRRLASEGARLLEISGDSPSTHIDLRDASAAAALKTVLDEVGASVHSAHAAFTQPSRDDWDISSPQPEIRKRAIANLAAAILGSVELGASHVIIHPGDANRGPEHLLYSNEGLTQLAETAASVGVRIAVENLHTVYVGHTVEEMRVVLEGLRRDFVGFCLDTGHAMLGPDKPQDYVRAFGDRLIAIHWHDNSGSGDDHTYPGFGHTDWDAEFLPALRDIGYDRPITIEAIPPADVPIAQAISEAESALAEFRAPRFG
jgi:sugar phosphate isomerase/epimerase